MSKSAEQKISTKHVKMKQRTNNFKLFSLLHKISKLHRLEPNTLKHLSRRKLRYNVHTSTRNRNKRVILFNKRNWSYNFCPYILLADVYASGTFLALAPFNVGLSDFSLNVFTKTIIRTCHYLCKRPMVSYNQQHKIIERVCSFCWIMCQFLCAFIAFLIALQWKR